MPSDLSVATFFAAVPDPRVDRTKKHLLGDILVIALAATVAGVEPFPAVAAFGRARQDWLAGFLRLPNGIPSADTFRRVFARLDHGRSGHAWPTGCRRCARRPRCGTSPSTGWRYGEHGRPRSAGACTWSTRGPPRAG